MPRRIVLLLALLASANLLLLAVAQASSGRATTRAAGTVVAVVDTGVSPHPALAGRLLGGLDLVDGDRDAADDSGHGTAVATVLAQACPGCTILPVRVLAGDAAAPWSRIAAGIVRAVDAGARVVNVSIAGPGGSPELRAAVDYAAARDVVVVAAAGNAGAAGAQFPAAYDGVVGVTALDASGGLHEWSSRGRWADAGATGCATITSPVGGAAWACGTSFAAPRIAAAAALARAADPAAPAAAVAARLPRRVAAELPLPRVAVAGDAVPGATLRASASGRTLGAMLRWFRCVGVACAPVGGASYRVRSADAGATLVARLVTQPFGGLSVAASAPVRVR